MKKKLHSPWSGTVELRGAATHQLPYLATIAPMTIAAKIRPETIFSLRVIGSLGAELPLHIMFPPF